MSNTRLTDGRKNEILLDDDSDNFSDRSSLDEFAEWPWLEQIDGVATEEESRVATCDAKLIRRDRIRSHFWAKMEAPADETADLAYELFDTHGRLDRRLYAPGYKRGTDVWGSELDHGDILLFHELQVASQWRRLGIGSRIVQGILQTVRGKSSHFFALVRPGYINRTREADPEDKIGVSKIIAMATQFWQSLGFRRVGSSLWFAFADDVSHPSRKLNASEDWNPPKNWKYDNLIPDATQDALTRIFLSDNPDAACVRQLRDILPPEIGDTRWLSTDDSGNTVLHLAAMSVKPGAVEYVLSRRPDLASTRNHDGNTPLETLQANMESMRTRAIYGRRIAPNSDRFNGFGQPALACVGILSGTEIFDLDKLSPADRAAVSSTTDPQASSIPEADLICHTLRLNYGCICGECIGGFLSPRMQYALLCQAEFQHDLMQDGLDLTGPEWHSNYGGILNFLPTTVQENLKTNKSMRQGFINMCNHISTCLKRKKIPNEDNVLFTLRNETSEWPPVTENYLEGGGTVAGVATILFEEAMYANQWSGDVTHQGIFQDKIEELPACRNDDEFGFVSGMCGYIRVSNGPSIDMLDDLSDTD